ncbi:unnamed protein product [Adineta steineri]|uniref:EGF-like domain-containing protein n=1 Tax=Adineta steineri TaxID=433720 RepID=A0A814UKE6_9BILA|nr:unnamed protein product [Adineta steineri]CAF1505218.1 unnamed protein product [Adineta steineri]
MNFILFGSFLLIIINYGEATTCPTGYNVITQGCYKVINGTGGGSWNYAREYCYNDSSVLLKNETVPNATTHLLALEVLTEKNSLFYWMAAYGLHSQFWIDGTVSLSTWEWSGQSITWYFEASQRAVIGNGTNYKLVYNSTQQGYQIADDIQNSRLFFICEYQVPCINSTTCQPNGQCYLNLGQELCVCNPGYTGVSCETEVDNCLSAPCQHDGVCIDAINNYTCDCSSTFYTGPNCDIELPDKTEHKRSTAFWTNFGLVMFVIAMLTISDLPWHNISTSMGCSNYNFNIFGKKNIEESTNEMDVYPSESTAYNGDNGGKKKSVNDGVTVMKGKNYNVMNTVWNPDYSNFQTPRNPQYNGYFSPDQNTVPSITQIQSHAINAASKPKPIEDKRIYAVDINDSTATTTTRTATPRDPADTMVSWTQQLQEQLRNKKARETSAASTKQLIHSANSNDN